MSEPPQEQEQQELSQVLEDRREKLERIREAGIEPFPHAFPGVGPIAAVHAAHASLPAGEDSDSRYRVAGSLTCGHVPGGPRRRSGPLPAPPRRLGRAG